MPRTEVDNMRLEEAQLATRPLPVAPTILATGCWRTVSFALFLAFWILSFGGSPTLDLALGGVQLTLPVLQWPP